MESGGIVGPIQASTATDEPFVGNGFTFESRGPIAVKGIGNQPASSS